MWIDTLKSNFEHKIKGNQIILKYCPFCNDDNYNIEFSIEKGIFHCWVCSFSGTVYKFLILNNLPLEKDDWKVSFVRYIKAGDELSIDSFVSIDYVKYKHFFISKGLELQDVKKYRLLYSNYGKYKNKLVIPLYEGNKLVYFVTRDLTVKGKYYNMKRSKVDILPYYLGEKNRYWLYLLEGVFDALSVNKLGFSAGILLGSNISEPQIEKIKRFGFKRVVICLDGDLKEKAIELYDRIKKFNIDCRIIFILGEEDPNDIFVRNQYELRELLCNPKELILSDRVTIMLEGK